MAAACRTLRLRSSAKNEAPALIQRIRSQLVMKYSITEAETYLRNGRRLATIPFNDSRRIRDFFLKPLGGFCGDQLTLGRPKNSNSGLLPSRSHTLFAAWINF